MRAGATDEQVHAACKIDPWFIGQLRQIIDLEARVKAHGLPDNAEWMRNLKANGFSDARLAL